MLYKKGYLEDKIKLKIKELSSFPLYVLPPSYIHRGFFNYIWLWYNILWSWFLYIALGIVNIKLLKYLLHKTIAVTSSFNKRNLHFFISEPYILDGETFTLMQIEEYKCWVSYGKLKIEKSENQFLPHPYHKGHSRQTKKLINLKSIYLKETKSNVANKDSIL